MFKDYVVEKINIYITSNEHKSYVRSDDYFEENPDVEVYETEEPSLATYEFPDTEEISTPSVSRFYYDRSGTKLWFWRLFLVFMHNTYDL